MIYKVKKIDVPPVSGVYSIRCHLNGRVYVGSSGNIRKRCLSHLRRLRGAKHENMFLQMAWDKHGEAMFDFTLLEEVKLDDLFNREEFWMGELNAHKDKGGYNILPHAGSVRGMDAALRATILPHARKAMNEGLRRYWDEMSPEERKYRRAITQESNARAFVVRYPDGFEDEIFCLKEFCEQADLSYNAMKKVSCYRAKEHRGFHVRKVGETPEVWQQEYLETTRSTNIERWTRELERKGRRRKTNMWILREGAFEVARFTSKEALAAHVGATPGAVKTARQRSRPISRGPLKGFTIM